MNVLKVILAILLFPLILLCSLALLFAFAVAQYIDDIYDDDMYWGGKE